MDTRVMGMVATNCRIMTGAHRRHGRRRHAKGRPAWLHAALERQWKLQRWGMGLNGRIVGVCYGRPLRHR